MRRAGLLACLVLLASVPSALRLEAGWASLGTMPAPRRDGQTLTFRNDQGVVALTVLAPDIVRVRFAPGPALGRDHSYAVVKTDFGDPGAAFDLGSGETVVRTRDLRITVRHDPFRVAFASADGESLDE